jgi:peptidoglycan/LPS O-acetylase OafA/YrhL
MEMPDMTELPALLSVLLALSVAIHQWRRMRAQGTRIEWGKTIVAALGVILVTAASITALFAGLSYGDLYGLAGFAIVETIGLTLLITAINRHWPKPSLD